MFIATVFCFFLWFLGLFALFCVFCFFWDGVVSFQFSFYSKWFGMVWALFGFGLQACGVEDRGESFNFPFSGFGYNSKSTYLGEVQRIP